MMHTPSLSLASAALALAASLGAPAQAAVPLLESVGKPASIKCGYTTAGAVIYAIHSDKIIFSLLTQIQAADPADQPALDQLPRQTELDIKVRDTVSKVADLRAKVLTFLGAVDTAANRAAVRIIDVDYAVVCPAVAQ